MLLPKLRYTDHIVLLKLKNRHILDFSKEKNMDNEGHFYEKEYVYYTFIKNILQGE